MKTLSLPRSPGHSTALPSHFLTVSIVHVLFTSGPWPPGPPPELWQGKRAGGSFWWGVSWWVLFFVVVGCFAFKLQRAGMALPSFC